MISPEQRELADYVKEVHLSLRRKTRQFGAERAWEEHLRDEHVLRKYAFCMKKLAEEYWSRSNQSKNDTLLCRIEWIINYIVTYFQKGLIKSELEKEFKRMEMFHKKGALSVEELELYKNSSFPSEIRYKLLDVGSCYNPFQKFDFLEVYPIDLYPANPEVKKCNFIETEVGDVKSDWFHDDLKQLPSDFFDVVVFSLFLEYLPSPQQRYVACLNGYECLRTNGLLLIVTPDSKHATANAAIMKSWKMAAARIGFVRTKLEKLKYIYCMAFRKSVSQKYPLLLYNVKEAESNPEETFVIPQDSVDYKLEEESVEKFEREENALRELFDELPLLFCVVWVNDFDMDPALLKERELFKKRALATPSVETKAKKETSSPVTQPKDESKKPRPRLVPSGPKLDATTYKTMTGSSNYKFGVLAKIVRHLKARHQEGDDHPLNLEELLDETNQLDVGNKVKQWLLNEALIKNPKVEVTPEQKFLFKPPYKVRDKKGMLKLLKHHDLKGLGGILLEDIQESLPNCEKILRALNNEIIYIQRPVDKKKILFYNDRTANLPVDEEFQKLWRAVAVESMDDQKIEEYLEKQGIKSMQDHTLKKLAAPIKRKKVARKKVFKKPRDNEHLADVLQTYEDK